MYDMMKVNELARSALALERAGNSFGDDFISVTVSKNSECPQIHVYDWREFIKSFPNYKREYYIDEFYKLSFNYGGCEFFCLIEKAQPLP